MSELYDEVIQKAEVYNVLLLKHPEIQTDYNPVRSCMDFQENHLDTLWQDVQQDVIKSTSPDSSLKKVLDIYSIYMI